jgi:hypothetical protein
MGGWDWFPRWVHGWILGYSIVAALLDYSVGLIELATQLGYSVGMETVIA